MTPLSHQDFQFQISQAASSIAIKAHPEDINTLKAIKVVVSFYGEKYKVLAGLSHLGKTFAAIGQYHISKWLKNSNVKKLKKIGEAQKNLAIFNQYNNFLNLNCAIPEDKSIFLSYKATLDNGGFSGDFNDSVMGNMEFNTALSLFHETAHLIEHLPIITPKNTSWEEALAKINSNPEGFNDEIKFISRGVQNTMKMLPEEMFADCFSILVAEMTGWGDRATLAKHISVWRQEMYYPNFKKEESEAAWMSHYTHTACDLLADRKDLVKDTRDAKELAGLVAWEAWSKLQEKMEKELWFFKTMGLGNGNESFCDFTSQKTQTKTHKKTIVYNNSIKTSPRCVLMKPFK